MIDHFDMPAQLCPVCNYRFNAASNINGDGKPEPDSITLCFKCGVILIWDNAMNLRKLTAQEIKELPPDIFQLVAQIQQRILIIRAERN